MASAGLAARASAGGGPVGRNGNGGGSAAGGSGGGPAGAALAQMCHAFLRDYHELGSDAAFDEFFDASMVYHVNSKVLYDKVALKESEDALRATLDDISVTVTNTVVMGTTVHLEYVYRGLKREDIDPADVDEMARRIGRPDSPGDTASGRSGGTGASSAVSLGSSRSPGGGASGGDLAGAGGAGGSGNGGEEDPDLFTQNFQVKFRFSDGRVVEGWSEYAFDRFDEYMAAQAEPVFEPATPIRSDPNDAFAEAKAYLQSRAHAGASDAPSLYDHMVRVFYELLETRPDDPLEALEDVSKALKRTNFDQPRPVVDEAPVLKPKEEASAVAMAASQVKMFKRQRTKRDRALGIGLGEGESYADDSQQGGDGLLPNVVAECATFSEAGVSLGREESYRIMLAMKELRDREPVRRLRLFGKIFGSKANYIVVEAVYIPEGWPDMEAPVVLPEGSLDDLADLRSNDGRDSALLDGPDGDDLITADDVQIRPDWRPPPVIPKEYRGGVNKFVYWVTPYAGGAWTQLPDVTPAQITAARKIRKMFTGDLESPIDSYPPFPGVEKNYLRAQIARIRSATAVAPAGFYHFEGDSQNGSLNNSWDGSERSLLTDAYNYRPPEDLTDPEFWVHVEKHIYKDGLTVPYEPPRESRSYDSQDPDAEHDGESEYDRPHERQIKLLRPVIDDETVGQYPAWSLRLSSELIPRYATVFMKSNRWPGAVAYADGNQTAFVYVGNGLKYLGAHYTPPLPDEPMEEYPEVEDIMERPDPTLEQLKEAEALANPRGSGEYSEEGGSFISDQDSSFSRSNQG